MKKKLFDNPNYARIMTVLTLVFSALAIYIITGVNRFGSLSKKAFIAVNLFVYLLVICIVLLVLLSIRKKNQTFKITMMVVLVIGSCGLLYLTRVLGVVNSSLTEITTETKKTEKKAVFVVNSDSKIEELEDLKDKKVGIVDNDNFTEGNTMPKEELEKNKVDVKYKHYSNYSQMLHALNTEKIDVGSFPLNYVQLLETEETEKELKNTKIVYEYSALVDNVDNHSGTELDVTKTPFTILMMGNDGGRTDSLMLGTVNPTTMQVTLTSIARDSYVPIACYNNNARDKINHARMVSRECTIKTVEDLLDIKVDFFAEVNFQGIIDIVDALGGIEVDSPVSFVGQDWTKEEKPGVRIKKGLHEINGVQALAFLRERYSFADGDFQRQQNQQQVINQLVNKAVEIRDVNKLLNVLKAAGNNVETNVSVNQMVDILNLALARMDSSYLKSPSIFTFYGSRITGRGTMLYEPNYGMDLYYYVLYNGSIKEAQDFMAWNLRTDNNLDLPKGFNYDFNEEHKEPIFSTEEFSEDVDIVVPSEPEVDYNDNDIEENQQPEEQLIYMEDFVGQSLGSLESFLSSHGLSYTVIANESVVAPEASLVGSTVVKEYDYRGESVKKGTTIGVSLLTYTAAEEVPEEKPVEKPEQKPEEKPEDPEEKPEDKPTSDNE